MAFDNILVVCVGNICRSPMAAALLTEYYPQKRISSAGISALIGCPADAKATAVMADNNIDISLHTAQQISTELVENMDLILTMSIDQTRWIENEWPYCRGKTFRIGHWNDKDIEDPYLQDRSAFEAAKEDIINSLAQWADKIS